jgi:hypothetical protein
MDAAIRQEPLTLAIVANDICWNTKQECNSELFGPSIGAKHARLVLGSPKKEVRKGDRYVILGTWE